MIRKPQPKEAARAVAELLARNGFAVSRALSLEVIATVEGFNDWNTMSAAIRGGSHLTPTALDSDVDLSVPDSEGPFTVHVENVTYYTRMPRYAGACDEASVMASDNLDANGRLVQVRNANGAVVAAYIAEDSTIHTFGGDALDVLPQLPEMGRYIEANWDVEDVLADFEQLRIHLCDNLEIAMKTDNDSFMGYLQYERTESGRVHNTKPQIVPVYYRQDGEFKVNPELPDNLRLSLERILTQ
jgi:hypothetical protein